MQRQSIIYLILSILVIIFAKFINMLLVYMAMLYAYFNVLLHPLSDYLGLNKEIYEIILLVFIPVLIMAIPALFYQLMKKRLLPYFYEITWVLWLSLVLSHLLIH